MTSRIVVTCGTPGIAGAVFCTLCRRSIPAFRAARGSTACSTSTRLVRLLERTGTWTRSTLAAHGSLASEGAPSSPANTTSSRFPPASSSAGMSRRTYSSPPPVSRGTRCRTLRPTRTALAPAVDEEHALDRGLHGEPLTVAVEPVGGRLAQSRSRFVHANDCVPELLRVGGFRYESVHALLDELHSCVVGRVDDDGRRAYRGRLDHDEPVTLAPRRKDEAERSLDRVLDELAGHEPRRAHSTIEPALVDQPQQRLALRPVAEDRRAQLRYT